MDQHGTALSVRVRYLIIAPPLIFLGIFYFYPLASIFGLSFSPEAAGYGSGLSKLFQTGYYARVLWFTTWQAALSTLLTLLCALPGAYVFANYEFRGKRLIQSLSAVPFVLPTMVTAAAFKSLLGDGGLVNSGLMSLFGLDAPPISIDQTVWFFLLAHVFFNYTVVLRIVGGFWSRLPRELGPAAFILGASKFQAFVRITLPLLTPAILAASLLVFVFCFTSFGTVLILGGPRLATLEVEIYRQAVNLFNLPMAAALSLLQIIFTFGLMAFYTWFERKSAVSMAPDMEPQKGKTAQDVHSRVFVLISMGFMALLLGAPLLALIISSVQFEGGFTLDFYAELMRDHSQSILYVPPVKAVLNSLGYALSAMLMALALGGLSAGFLVRAKKKSAAFWDPLFMLPLSTSAVTLGFGFIVALDEPPLNLRTSWVLPAVAHALVALPFVIRSLLPAWRSIPQSLREAAAVLGASPWLVWRHVDWPILGRALAVGAVFAFAISMGEFGATVFVARPQAPTLPLAIYRYLGHPGMMNYGQAMAMSCILLFTTAVGFIFLERSRNAPGSA